MPIWYGLSKINPKKSMNIKSERMGDMFQTQNKEGILSLKTKWFLKY